MNAPISCLTFLPDPSAYNIESDVVHASVPAGVASAEELIALLKNGLGLPEWCGANWNALDEVLRFWSGWRTQPRRAIIVHEDLPLLDALGKNWLEAKNYLEVLIGSISFLQEQATRADAAEKRELIAVFPERFYDEIQAVLNHPPAWELGRGYRDANFSFTLDPDLPTIFQYVRSLDGLTTEICVLRRQDAGSMTVHYLKSARDYVIEYQSLDQESILVASSGSQTAFPPTLDLASTLHVLEMFFTSGQRSAEVSWSELSSEENSKLKEAFERQYYHSNFEVLLELDIQMARWTIEKGIETMLSGAEQIPDPATWQQILTRQDATPDQRLTALCIVGLSNLPEAPELLLPFLKSPVKKERWISARFLGMIQEEQALPVLFSMLTDELPGEEARDQWYDEWRFYAPRLLRKWQNQETTAHLREALAAWLQNENRFDQDLSIWQNFEAELCYELGYREDFAALTDQPVADTHKKELLSAMKKGQTVKSEEMSYLEEYVYKKAHRLYL